MIKAVAEGDLSQKMVLEIDGKTVQGEFLRIGSTVNRMVDQLNAFAGEVTRVAREVGTEGVLGGQANVQGVSGTWKDLTDNVNVHGDQPDQPGAQHRRRDDGGRERRPVAEDHGGGEGRDARAEEHDQHDGRPALGLRRRSDARGARSGNGGRARRPGEVPGVAGTWKDLTDNVNSMAANLTSQVRNIADVTTAVANGDLSQKITVEAKGEMLELKNTINTMVDQLSQLRVGSDARGARSGHGRRARRPGEGARRRRHVEGSHRQRERAGGNLTVQVRNIADVTTAVANGDLSRKITVEARGEMLRAQGHHQHDGRPAVVVRRRGDARGARGGHRGQARRPGRGAGVAGTWKDLTDNVNVMAGNLTARCATSPS